MERAIQNPGESVKEYVLGLDVFDRSPDFDPKIDSVVRVQTGRLRQKLAHYYAESGAADPIRIDIPRGSYTATITDSTRVEAEPPPVAIRRKRLPWMWAGIALVLLFGIVLALWGGFAHVSAPVITQFTSDLGIEDDASFSPDGDSVVYSATSGHGRDLFVKSIHDGRIRRLTDDRATNLHPSWSPDGSAIAFARAANAGYEIWLIRSEGGRERKIGESRSTTTDEFGIGPVWTGDGRSLIIADKPGVAGADSLFALDVAAGSKRRLTTPSLNDIGDYAPAVSPDGRTVAFARLTSFSTGDVYTTPLTGGKEQRLTTDRTVIRGLSFLPDGGLMISSNRGGTQRLWRMKLPRGSLEPFTGTGLNAIHPSASAKGHRLVYTEWQTNSNIWRVSLADPGSAAALITSTRMQDSARYSPDGSRIAFVSTRSGNQEIWASDADGQNLQRLTNFNGPSVGSPRWSPDGAWIAFDSRATGRSNVYLVSADGKTTRRITDADGDRMMPAWSRDNRSLLVSSRTNGVLDLLRIPLDGSAPVQLTRDRGFDAVEAPQRDLIVFTKQRVAGFWSMKPDGTGEAPIAELAGVDAHRYWMATHEGIYFVSGDAPPFPVRLYEFDTHRIRDVGRLSGQIEMGTPSLDVSPDGRYLLYGQVDNMGADLILVDRW